MDNKFTSVDIREINERAKQLLATAGPVTAAMNQLTANETQHGGQHYKGFKIQTWDFILDHNMGYLEGNVVKYVDRYKRKNGIEDLKKARHYLDKLIEQVEGTGIA